MAARYGVLLCWGVLTQPPARHCQRRSIAILSSLHCACVAKPKRGWMAFREAGMFPLTRQYMCLHRMLTFLDSVMGMADGEFAKVAMMDCIAQATILGLGTGSVQPPERSAQNRCAGGTVPSSALQHDGTVNVQECLMLWRQHHYHTVWGSLHPDPRTAPSDNITLCTYHAYFADPLPARGEVWSCAPCIAANSIPYPITSSA
jgi:hypothetical protein